MEPVSRDQPGEMTALIAEAARGIGPVFARAYGGKGARVAIADIKIARAGQAGRTLGEEAQRDPRCT